MYFKVLADALMLLFFYFLFTKKFEGKNFKMITNLQYTVYVFHIFHNNPHPCTLFEELWNT